MTDVTKLLGIYNGNMMKLGNRVNRHNTSIKRLKTTPSPDLNALMMGAGSTSLSGGGVSSSDLADLKRELMDLEAKVSAMSGPLSSVPPVNNNGMGVSIGRFNFNNNGDVLTWIEKYLPPSWPFGAFIDVYGLMARFVAQKGDGLAKSMDARAKVFLSSSEEIIMETFQACVASVVWEVPRRDINIGEGRG